MRNGIKHTLFGRSFFLGTRFLRFFSKNIGFHSVYLEKRVHPKKEAARFLHNTSEFIVKLALYVEKRVSEKNQLSKSVCLRKFYKNDHKVERTRYELQISVK